MFYEFELYFLFTKVNNKKYKGEIKVVYSKENRMDNLLSKLMEHMWYYPHIEMLNEPVWSVSSWP